MWLWIRERLRFICDKNLSRCRVPFTDSGPSTARKFLVYKIFRRSLSRKTATLSSTHYRISPLVQEGLKIPCIVNAKLIATKKNKKILAKYLEMGQNHYMLPWVLSWLCLLMKMQALQMVKTAPNVPIKGGKQIIEKCNNT